MHGRSSKTPKEPNKLAKYIADVVAGDATAEDMAQPPVKNAAAVALGRLGGMKGGKARAAKLTPEERKAIAKKAAAKRWGSRPSSDAQKPSA